VHVHQLPSWPQDHVDALSAVVDEVAKDHRQALQGISLNVEKLLSVGLDDL
jgi:hypothetical protein